MARITGEIVIDRPREQVFDFVSDERNEPSYNRQMLAVEALSDGPIGAGTQFRAQMRSGRRRTLPMLVEFTTFERPARLGSHSTFSGLTADGELTFEPHGDATLMRWTWEVTARGALKFLSPLVGWMGRRQERRIWSELKRCLETRP
jgi:uncharacterized protein YndB with AHSA1/START domain